MTSEPISRHFQPYKGGPYYKNRLMKKTRFQQNRAGNTIVVTASIPTSMAQWLAEQSQSERHNLTFIICRALRFEQERVVALGPNPSDDDLEFGRI